MNTIIEFEDLNNADLIKGALYKGGTINNLSSEPISKLLPVGNQSGIRFSGKVENPSIVVLYTTLNDTDWPDSINGDVLTYYGDNKLPGKEIHDLPGNKVLRSIFNTYHLSHKEKFPLILLFSKGRTGYDRVFEGVLKPGYPEFEETEDLIAIWKTKHEKRFQNYKAIFTLLKIENIARPFLKEALR
jgi:hypothetical protein